MTNTNTCIDQLTYFVSWIPFDDVTEPEYEEEFDSVEEAISFAQMKNSDGDGCIDIVTSNGDEIAW